MIFLPAAEAENPQGTEPAKTAEAWLVTYAPGEIYYERFGHNALWLKNPQRSINHLFNFGFFDFNQPNFLSRFLRGNTLYFSAARDPEAEFAEYRTAGRSIGLQKLNLDAEQYQLLEEYLITQVQPDKRNYRYESFRNNCSTRVRDALDIILNNQFNHFLNTQPVDFTIRQQIHAAANADPWLYLGIDLATGPSLDRSQDLWQAAFIPAVLSTAVNAYPGLVSRQSVYYQSDVQEVEKHPLRFLFLAALVVVIAMLLLVRPWRNESARIAANRVASSWLLICSLGGMFLLYLWLATSHIDTQGNWNVLLLNPLYLAAIFFLWKYPSRARWLSIFIIGSTLLAAVGGYLSGQNMLAPLVFFVPSLLAASILLWPGKAGDDSG